MLQLKECKTAAEVIANYREVRKRIRAWVPYQPPPLPPPPPPPPPRIKLPWREPTVMLILPGRRTKVRTIQRAVARECGFALADILGPSRKKKLTLARQIGMWLALQTGLSFPVIGRMFNRDHTTVLHAKRKIDAYVRCQQQETLATIAAIEKALQ
jgi:hypothetical protein